MVQNWDFLSENLAKNLNYITITALRNISWGGNTLILISKGTERIQELSFYFNPNTDDICDQNWQMGGLLIL